MRQDLSLACLLLIMFIGDAYAAKMAPFDAPPLETPPLATPPLEAPPFDAPPLGTPPVISPGPDGAHGSAAGNPPDEIIVDVVHPLERPC